MTRIILFTFFLSLCAFFLNLAGYRTEHDKTVVLNRDHLIKKLDQYKKDQEALLAKKDSKQEPEKKEEGLNLEDPKIQAAIALYTEAGKCASCHGDQAQGIESAKAPLLAGQHSWYIIDQFSQLGSGSRPAQAAAPEVHKSLNEQEIKDVAKYISLLRVE